MALIIKLVYLAALLNAAPPARTATFTPPTYGWMPLTLEAGPAQLSQRGIKDARLYARLNVDDEGRRVTLHLSGFIYGAGGTRYRALIDHVVYTAPRGFRVQAHAAGHYPLTPVNGAVLAKIRRSGSAMHLGSGLISSARARTATTGIAVHVGFQKIKFNPVRVELTAEAR